MQYSLDALPSLEEGVKTEIPIMHCFNNKYSMAASVAFCSMLENANPKYRYCLYVLHTDISESNQQLLRETVAIYTNASLCFIRVDDSLDSLFAKTVTIGHYSKEIFYKFLAPHFFPQYDVLIIADVDVVYLDDISPYYFMLDPEEDIYFAGHRGCCPKNSWVEDAVSNDYKKDFSDAEIAKLATGAGFWIFNIKKMRQDGLQDRFLEFAHVNAYRIRQPEQDVVNLVCHPYIKYLPYRTLVCTYAYELYDHAYSLDDDIIYTKEELRQGLASPVQLHYAGVNKPWAMPECTKSEEWFKFLVKTPYLKEWLMMQSKARETKLVEVAIPFIRNTELVFWIRRKCVV